MGRSSQIDEGVAGRPEAISFARSDHLAVLGSTDSPAAQPLHPQTPSAASKPTGAINIANVLRLLEWQDYRCALTGRMLTPETASLDHIVPVRDGGQHIIDNVQVLHKDVNRAKSTLNHEQFVQLCREVVEHVAATSMEGESQ